MNGKHNVYVTLGASNHSKEERHLEDYYATQPKAVQLLLAEYKPKPKKKRVLKRKSRYEKQRAKIRRIK